MPSWVPNTIRTAPFHSAETRIVSHTMPSMTALGIGETSAAGDQSLDLLVVGWIKILALLSFL